MWERLALLRDALRQAEARRELAEQRLRAADPELPDERHRWRPTDADFDRDPDRLERPAWLDLIPRAGG